jgi:hypothetical protein
MCLQCCSVDCHRCYEHQSLKLSVRSVLLEDKVILPTQLRASKGSCSSRRIVQKLLWNAFRFHSHNMNPITSLILNCAVVYTSLTTLGYICNILISAIMQNSKETTGIV